MPDSIARPLHTLQHRFSHGHKLIEVFVAVLDDYRHALHILQHDIARLFEDTGLRRSPCAELEDVHAAVTLLQIRDNHIELHAFDSPYADRFGFGGLEVWVML